MKKQMKKTTRLITAACLSGILAAGCGASPASGPADNSVIDLSSSAAPENAEPAQAGTTHDGSNADSPADSTGAETANADTGAESTEGKWHVYPPDVASAIDADFEGMVWKIEENTFYIVPDETEILDGGTLLTGAPSPDADIPDSELAQVVFDESTRFYTRTIYDGGERYEDSDAAFQDITKEQSVSLKGRFENDIFHATEVRIWKMG